MSLRLVLNIDQVDVVMKRRRSSGREIIFIILSSNGNLKFTLLSRYDGDEEDSLPQKLKTW